MKTNFSFFIFASLIWCVIEAGAQQNFKFHKEIRIDNSIYRYDTIHRIVYNRLNVLYKVQDSDDKCSFSVGEDLSSIEIPKKIFTKERITEIGNKNLPIVFYTDSTGQVKELKFFIKKCYNEITFTELRNLETEFKKHKFKLNIYCPGKEKKTVYSFSVILRFNRIYSEAK